MEIKSDDSELEVDVSEVETDNADYEVNLTILLNRTYKLTQIQELQIRSK